MLRHVDAVISTLLWPASVAHEATHYVASYRWLETVHGYDVHPFRGAWVNLELVEEAPRWATAVTAVAPTLIGTAFAGAALVLLAVGGGSFPTVAASPGRWLLIASWWLVYTTPSRADIAALEGGSGHANPGCDG